MLTFSTPRGSIAIDAPFKYGYMRGARVWAASSPRSRAWCSRNSWFHRGGIEDRECARAYRRRYYRDTVHQHGKKDWQAIAWLASVTEPEEFNPKLNLIIEQQVSVAIARLGEGRRSSSRPACGLTVGRRARVAPQLHVGGGRGWAFRFNNRHATSASAITGIRQQHALPALSPAR